MNRSVRIPLRGAGRGCKVTAFPNFGLYVYRAEALYLAVRGGGIGQDGNGGHAHVDALSFELVIHGTDWLLDPGTYVYTPDPVARDRYRSAAAHNGVLPQDPPGILDLGLFRLADLVTVSVESFDDRHFVGAAFADGHRHRREIRITDDELLLIDGDGASEVFTADSPERLEALVEARLPFCPGYGVRLVPSVGDSWRAVVRAFRSTSS